MPFTLARSVHATVAIAAATLLAFGIDRQAAAKYEQTVAHMLDHLAIEELTLEPTLALTAWAYDCADQPICAADCVETLKALGAGYFEPREHEPAFCAAFMKEGALARGADDRTKAAAALAWIRKRVQAAAAGARKGASADDRDGIDCRLSQLHLGGDARTCPRADALMAAATLSRMAKESGDQPSDVLWTAICSEIESCAGGCLAMLVALPRIAPEGAPRLPLCADAKTALGKEKVGYESLTRFGRQRAAAFVTRAAALLDPARGKAMRCDAAKIQLIAPEPACGR